MRVLRLVMGTAGLIFSILNRDILLGISGGFLLLIAVLNFDCGGVNGCSVKMHNPKMKTSGKETKKISYEEIV
jgi:membrane-bound ClpP family serine protease